MPTPNATAVIGICMGTGVKLRTSRAAIHAIATPIKPPIEESTEDSIRNWLRMSWRARADRFADADFLSALGDDGEHDVHDDDAADHHEDRDNADSGRRQARW